MYPELQENIIQTPPPSIYPDLSYFSPCWMIRRSVYETLGGMRPWFRSAEDTDFALRLEEKFPFATLSEPLFFYRNYSDARRLTQHPNQILYEHAANWAAICRRRGGADPINETTDIKFIFRHLSELPELSRHTFIRRWGRSRRQHLSSDNVAGRQAGSRPSSTNASRRRQEKIPTNEIKNWHGRPAERTLEILSYKTMTIKYLSIYGIPNLMLPPELAGKFGLLR